MSGVASSEYAKIFQKRSGFNDAKPRVVMMRLLLVDLDLHEREFERIGRDVLAINRGGVKQVGDVYRLRMHLARALQVVEHILREVDPPSPQQVAR